MTSFSLLVALLSAASLGAARKITVKNSCGQTVWPAMFTQRPEQAPSQPTGWELGSGQSTEFEVVDTWMEARIWGRLGCSGDGDAFHCTSGDCGGRECKPGVTGVPPVSLAEFTLQTDTGPDNYDISLVDGFNLPIAIYPSKDCPAPKCTADLNPGCPDDLRADDGLGCRSACQRDALQGNAGDNANCCSGSHDQPETCPREGVEHYDYFKNGCRDAYAYAYDEKSESALWTCDGNGGLADYTVEFCPS